jgi:hypothetical protein
MHVVDEDQRNLKAGGKEKRMSALNEQIETIRLLAAHETLLARLYNLYATAVPAYQQFFADLAQQEVAHAQRIEDFIAKVQAGTLAMKPGRFNAQVLATSLKYINDQLRKAETGAPNAITALSNCVDMEEALIERKYYEVVEADSPTLKQLLSQLAADTEAHRQQARQALESERRGRR